MTRRRLFFAMVGGLLIFVIAATSSLTPGIRHTHQGGELAHSHASSHARARVINRGHEQSHSHVHSDSHRDSNSHVHDHPHPYSHSHGAGHSHIAGHTHSHDKTPGSVDVDEHSAESHIHVSLFGFNLTLPDFFNTGKAAAYDSGLANHADASESSTDGVTGDVMEIRPPFTFAQLINFMMTLGGPLPERPRLSPLDDSIRDADINNVCISRYRDTPELPPPESA